jgi:hypothetical protein
MSRFIADPTFGLSAQALAVHAMLVQSECDDLAEYDEKLRDYKIETHTYPWFNGREKGVCLEVRPNVGCRKALLITFGEHRNSDGIFVDSWLINEYLLNPPTVADFQDERDEAYRKRTIISYGQVNEAVAVIRQKIKVFMATMKPGAGPARGVLPDLGDDPEQALLDRLAPPDQSPRAYVVTKDGGGGTSLQGEVTTSFAKLLLAFGKPTYTGRRGNGGDGKVSTEWVFRDPATGDTFTIYDYKATSLYDPDAPSVKAFRELPEYEWHIGAKNKAAAERFIVWLRAQVA